MVLVIDGFRVITNTGKHGQQEIYHLHYHLIGGRQLKWEMYQVADCKTKYKLPHIIESSTSVWLTPLEDKAVLVDPDFWMK